MVIQLNIQSINPATGETIRSYDMLSSEETTQIIHAMNRAYMDWRRTSFQQRGECFRRAAKILREKAGEYARLMTQEMGKPLREAKAEAEKCAWVCEYYADNAETFLQNEVIETDTRKSYIAFQPLGIIFAIMPWNFPFWQVFRFAAPSLMAGNVGLLKHAPNVPGCALAIEAIFRKAGFPENVFRSILVDVDQVPAIIENEHVRAVTLTGSTRAGKAVAEQAGAALKKTVLELGGSDPYIILRDADLDLAVNACVTSRLLNSGQSCIAAKRFIVVEEVRAEFERRFVEKMRAAVMGDPTDDKTTVGPLARVDLRDQLHDQVQRSIAAGARVLIGGQLPGGAGAFYPPTVLTDVKPGMPAYHEELFGPAAAIIPVKDEAQAIRVANDTIYGLGAAVFTRDLARGEYIATTQIEAGSCFINAFVKSDPRLPFGGIKESGYGRELSVYGIKEFVNIKTVYLA